MRMEREKKAQTRQGHRAVSAFPSNGCRKTAWAEECLGRGQEDKEARTRQGHRTVSISLQKHVGKEFGKGDADGKGHGARRGNERHTPPLRGRCPKLGRRGAPKQREALPSSL